MRRTLRVLLVALGLMALLVLPGLAATVLVPCSEGGFRKTEKGVGIWVASGGGWEVGGFGTWRMDQIQRMIELKPPEVEAAKLYERMVAEPGEWLGFLIKFRAVQKVTFTRDTKIVLTDKDGKRYESEGCFFYPDRMQTELYEARKMAVVVTKESVYCRPEDGLPGGVAKFARGSFRLKEIVEFEVVGAIEEAASRKAR